MLDPVDQKKSSLFTKRPPEVIMRYFQASVSSKQASPERLFWLCTWRRRLRTVTVHISSSVCAYLNNSVVPLPRAFEPYYIAQALIRKIREKHLIGSSRV